MVPSSIIDVLLKVAAQFGCTVSSAQLCTCLGFGRCALVLDGRVIRHVARRVPEAAAIGGMDSIVFGPIRWCVWSFRPSSPLRLPHLKFLFVCLLLLQGMTQKQGISSGIFDKRKNAI